MNPVDGRRDAPATGRNRQPILEILQRTLEEGHRVLEIACGTGQHAVFFSRALPRVRWLPTDVDEGALQSTQAWLAHEAVANMEEPMGLDVTAWPASLPTVDAVYCANMIHIAPWRACLGLLAGAGQVLPEGAPLILYGPFRRGGVHTAPSNEAFDRSLRLRDPSWGVRDLETVESQALAEGLALEEVVSMPANNLTLIFRRHTS